MKERIKIKKDRNKYEEWKGRMKMNEKGEE